MSDFVTLGDHISIQKGKAPLATGYSGPGAKPYLNPEYLRGRANAELAKPGSDAVHVSDGDTILLWDGSNAGEFFKAKSGLAASTMAKITPDERFKSPYFFHVTKHAEPYLKGQTNGTGIPHVDRELLEAIRVFCPVPAEQLRLAEILDTLDTAIHETEAIIAKLKAVKQGLLHDLLTRGIAANGELRPPQAEAPHLYKESPLGWIPQEWAALPFGSRVAVIDPNPSHRYPREQESGVPICSTENFDGEDDFWLEQSKKMPDSVFDFQNSRCNFADDQVIFARKGRIGLARRYGQERKVFSHTVVVFTRKSELTNQDWLLWLARSSAFLDGIRIKMNSNSGVPTLGIELINSVMTAFPPAFEQAHIARMLDSSSSRIRQEEQGLAALKSVRCGLMDDLLTGRIRVTALLTEAAEQPGSA